MTCVLTSQLSGRGRVVPLTFNEQAGSPYAAGTMKTMEVPLHAGGLPTN
jgi:hypothetical protein